MSIKMKVILHPFEFWNIFEQTVCSVNSKKLIKKFHHHFMDQNLPKLMQKLACLTHIIIQQIMKHDPHEICAQE